MFSLPLKTIGLIFGHVTRHPYLERMLMQARGGLDGIKEWTCFPTKYELLDLLAIENDAAFAGSIYAGSNGNNSDLI